MAGNLAYKEEPRKELLDEKTVLMSPRPSVDHNRVASNIFYAFHTFLKNKPCEAFSDGVDVYLLLDGRFILDDVYTSFYGYEELTEEEKNYKKEIPVSLFNGFKIPLDDIFSNLFK